MTSPYTSSKSLAEPTRRNTVEKLLLTPEEAARSIGLGRTKVYELLRAGALESVQIGAARRVPVEALREYVERLRGEAQESAA